MNILNSSTQNSRFFSANITALLKSIDAALIVQILLGSDQNTTSKSYLHEQLPWCTERAMTIAIGKLKSRKILREKDKNKFSYIVHFLRRYKKTQIFTKCDRLFKTKKENNALLRQ